MADHQTTVTYPRWMVQWFMLGCVGTACGLPLLAVAPLVGSLILAIGITSVTLSIAAGEDYDSQRG